MRIGRRAIGPGHPPYVIAEIGVNHDGSRDRCLELIDAAAACGADAVKLQFFRAELLMSRAATLAAYQAGAGETDPAGMLRRLELHAEDLPAYTARAHDRGVHAIVTVFTTELVPLAERAGFDAFKSASPDVVHRPLLERLAAANRPLIVSTGAATMGEVERAAAWLEDCDDLAFLHCVSAYPAPAEHAALGGIVCLAEALDRPVGYSDHTTLVETGALAVAAGAAIIEKHLTLDRRAAGPDHAASLEPDSLREYVRLARLAHAMLGPCDKRVLEVEREVRRVSRQSIVAARAIRAGETIRPGDLTVKRPGGGLEPWRLASLVGKTAARDLAPDEMIVEGDAA